MVGSQCPTPFPVQPGNSEKTVQGVEAHRRSSPVSKVGLPAPSRKEAALGVSYLRGTLELQAAPVCQQSRGAHWVLLFLTPLPLMGPSLRNQVSMAAATSDGAGHGRGGEADTRRLPCLPACTQRPGCASGGPPRGTGDKGREATARGRPSWGGCPWRDVEALSSRSFHNA